MPNVAVAVAIAAVAMLSSASARATQLDFSYSRQGGTVTSAWTQSSTPVVAFYISDGYTAVDVTSGVEDVNGALTPIGLVYFAPPAALGGYFLGSGVSDFGLGKLYRGTESAPVFAPGVFTGALGGTLTITGALSGAPEPATWFMMLSGLAAIGGVARSRRRSVA